MRAWFPLIRLRAGPPAEPLSGPHPRDGPDHDGQQARRPEHLYTGLRIKEQL